MPGHGQTLSFSLHDEMEGRPITPENVDLLTLHQFMGEVIELIQGEAKRAEMGQPSVVIEDGSVKLISVVASLVAASFHADISRVSPPVTKQRAFCSAFVNGLMEPRRSSPSSPPRWENWLIRFSIVARKTGTATG